MANHNQAPLFDLSRKARLINASSSGAIAGLTAAILDMVQAAPALTTSSEVGWLFLQASGRSCLAGAVLALLASVAALVGESFSPMRGASGSDKRRIRGAALGVTAAAAPLCIYVAVRLFQGGLTSRLPARSWLTVLSALILIGLVFAGAHLALAIIRRADRAGPMSLPIVILATIIFCIAALGHWTDGNLYRRLYLYLHFMLGLLTLGCFTIAFRITLTRIEVGARFMRFKVISLGMAVALCVAATLILDARQTVKVAAFENTSTTANLLQFFSWPKSRTRRGNPSKEIVKLREERERQARLASSGNFPVFPGAHILLVTVDALRADRLGIYGHSDRDLTPQLDKWANEKAVIFDRAYASAPHSSYSITSFHTSRFTHDEATLGKELNQPTIAEVLNKNGYKSIAFYTQGVFFTEGDKVGHYRRSQFGFETAYHGAPEPDALSDMAIAAIDRAVLNGEPPTFFWVHYFNVHEPYQSTRFGTAPADRYDSEIAEMDPEAVRLMRHAEEVLDNGVIIAFAADHGEEFKDHGGYYHGSSLYDEQVRVPLMIHVPNGGTGRVTTPVSIVGIAPTLLKLAGVMPAPTMIGQDLRPAIFNGDAALIAEPVFSAVVSQHMVVRWPWKLIVDPSSEQFSLFNLAKDPKEKFSLYDTQTTLANELMGELEGWLDELGHDEDASRAILNLGHMRDSRVVSGLIALMSNPDQPQEDRAEAAELLGAIRDYSVVPALKSRLLDPDEKVAVAAAFALGELGDMSGHDLIRYALYDELPEVRDRAALVLGLAGDDYAIPQLIEALGRNDITIREKAIKMLGRLGDPAALEPLLDMLEEFRSRYLTVLALGKIGDPRAYEPLIAVLENDYHTDTRGYTIEALGLLGNGKAIPRLLRVLEEEPAIKWTTESLVRLGAVGQEPLFGSDVANSLPALKSGWGECTESPPNAQDEFMGRTTCRTTGPRADLEFPSDVPESSLLFLRARHYIGEVDVVVPLEIYANGRKICQMELTREFQEARIKIPPGFFKTDLGMNHIALKLGKKGIFEVDHFLVLSLDE